MSAKEKDLQMGGKLNDEDDELLGTGEGADTLEEGEGSDTLEGDEGDDTLESAEGDDTTEGAEGDDTAPAPEGDDELSETLESDIEEAIEKQSRKSRIDRAKLRSINDDLAARQYEITKKLPQFKCGEKTIYELTPDEMTEAIEAIFTNPDIKAEDKPIWAREAIAARKQFFKELEEKGLVEDNQKAMNLDNTIWQNDWMTVQEQIIKANPKLEKHLPEVDEYMLKEFTKKPYLVARLRKGPIEKFHYALEVMDELDIDLREVKARSIDLKPTPKTPASVGKGKKVDSKASRKKPEYTTSQIHAMSMEDWDKHEDAISLAQREGRVKRK